MSHLQPIRGRHQDRAGVPPGGKRNLLLAHWRQECRDADEAVRKAKLAELCRRARRGLPLFEDKDNV
jgi:hypothetical protein